MVPLVIQWSICWFLVELLVTLRELVVAIVVLSLVVVCSSLAISHLCILLVIRNSAALVITAIPSSCVVCVHVRHCWVLEWTLVSRISIGDLIVVESLILADR
jgi:hypothetical protein